MVIGRLALHNRSIIYCLQFYLHCQSLIHRSYVDSISDSNSGVIVIPRFIQGNNTENVINIGYENGKRSFIVNIRGNKRVNQ